MDTNILDAKQAAELLGCSVSTIYEMVRDGRLPAKRIGKRKGIRILRQALLNWIAEGEEQEPKLWAIQGRR